VGADSSEPSLFLLSQCSPCRGVDTLWTGVLLCDLLQALGDAGAWLASNLLVPIVTGVFVGLALRAAAIAGEVSSHDLRAEEIDTDLTRWVRDRGRALTGEIFHAINLARQGVIEDVAQAPPPPGIGGTPGDQSNSGAFNNRASRIMRQALHEYRDEASGKVREYRAMARSEGWLHRWLRRLRHYDPPSALKLSPGNREVLESWRERTIPTHGEPTVTVGDDPTQAEDTKDIRPLEEDGLTWGAAAKRSAASS
jgi:hypothetical protein